MRKQFEKTEFDEGEVHMKLKIINIFKYLLFIIIPLLSVFLCVTFSLAQGERTEEIGFGVMLGIVLDFIYFIVLFLADRKNRKKD